MIIIRTSKPDKDKDLEEDSEKMQLLRESEVHSQEGASILKEFKLLSQV